MKNQYMTGLVTVLFITPALAADEVAGASWKGEAELGFISTSGNTETETLNAKTKLVNERDKWKHTFIAEATRASDKDVVTAQRYFVSGKSDYKYSEKNYIFALLKYEDDRFSGYDYQASLVIGYGHKIITRENLKLDAEIGAGTRHNEFDTGEKENEAILYAAMDLDWKISQSSSFNEKLTIEGGDTATITKSVSGLKSKINAKLASKITYTIKHVSEVPVGVEKTDKEIAVTLVYNF